MSRTSSRWWLAEDGESLVIGAPADADHEGGPHVGNDEGCGTHLASS